MEDGKKDVIPVNLNKRESFLELNISMGIQRKKILLRKIINELLKNYSSDLLNFDYLKQYWVFENE